MSAKMSFELDAGKILAKLHRGACQRWESKCIIINTGITDDQKELKPEQVDKSKINFDLEGGEYEIGVMLIGKDAQQKLSDMESLINPETDDKKEEKNDDKSADNKDKTLEQQKKPTTPEEKKQAQEEQKQKEEQQKKDDNQPITVNPNDKKLNEDYTQNTASRKEDVGKMSADDKKALSNQKDLAQEVIAAMTSADDKDKETAAKKLMDLADNADKEAAAALKKNHDIIKKFMESRINWAGQFLTEYLQTFAGKDAAGKLDVKNIATTFVPEDFDPYKTKKYKNYQIPAMTDEQVRQYKLKQLKENPDVYDLSRMCWKIAFNVNIGK